MAIIAEQLLDPDEYLLSMRNSDKGEFNYTFYKAMEENGIDFNTFQFLELFVEGRRQGRTTLELFKVIRDYLFVLRPGQITNIAITAETFRSRDYKLDMFLNIMKKLEPLFEVKNVDRGVVTIAKV